MLKKQLIGDHFFQNFFCKVPPADFSALTAQYSLVDSERYKKWITELKSKTSISITDPALNVLLSGSLPVTFGSPKDYTLIQICNSKVKEFNYVKL